MKLQSKSAITITLSAAMLLHGVLSAQNQTGGNDLVFTSTNWTLVEMIRALNDTAFNMTALLDVCEKDNYLAYTSNGTYRIMEGKSKCNNDDKDIKGEGTWKYQPSDSLLIDSYENGRKIYKKVLVLNDEVLKIQYAGENRYSFTLTYFSEKGIKNKLNSDLVVDNSNSSQNILQMIREYVLSANRYILVGNKEFENGIKQPVEDKNGALQTIALVPLGIADSAGSSAVKEKNRQLFGQAKNTATDFVITGNVQKASAERDKNRKFIGFVQYEVHILDIATGNTSARVFSSKEGNDKDEKSKDPDKKPVRRFWKSVGNVAGKFATVAGKSVLFAFSVLYDPYQMKSLYSYYFSPNTSTANNNEVKAVFSNVNSDRRQDNYDSTMALLGAISKSREDLDEFIGAGISLKIKINKIEGSGKKAEMYIEAGSNVSLKKDDVLKVVKISSTTVNGSTIFFRKELGKIKVNEILADVLASCSFDKGREEIMDAYSKNPSELVALIVD